MAVTRIEEGGLGTDSFNLPITLNGTNGASANAGDNLILDGTDVVYLTRETPKAHLISNMHIGSRLPAHASSIVRAILADLSEVAVKDIYKNRELSGGTNKAPQYLQQILSQRKIDVKRGYVWSVGMIEPNIGSCAATIYNHEGKPIAGLNVSGPKDIFINENSKQAIIIREAVLDAARISSAAMGFR